MSAPEQPCIRGCTRPVLTEAGEQEQQPRPATDGLLCRRCATRLTEMLAEIPELYLQLSIMPPVDYRVDKPGKASGKRSASPALARLDVVALQDDRTMRPEDDSEDRTLAVRKTIESWARLFAEDVGITGAASFGGALRLLTTWHGTLVAQPWVDDLWSDIDQVHTDLEIAVRVERPEMVGSCITMIDDDEGMPRPCGKRLFALAGEQVRCPRCRRVYDGMDLLRLADSRDQVEGKIG